MGLNASGRFCSSILLLMVSCLLILIEVNFRNALANNNPDPGSLQSELGYNH